MKKFAILGAVSTLLGLISTPQAAHAQSQENFENTESPAIEIIDHRSPETLQEGQDPFGGLQILHGRQEEGCVLRSCAPPTVIRKEIRSRPSHPLVCSIPGSRKVFPRCR